MNLNHSTQCTPHMEHTYAFPVLSIIYAHFILRKGHGKAYYFKDNANIGLIADLVFKLKLNEMKLILKNHYILFFLVFFFKLFVYLFGQNSNQHTAAMIAPPKFT